MLIEDLKAGNQEMRINAVCALIALGSDDAVPELLAAIKKLDDFWIETVSFECGQPDLRRAAVTWIIGEGKPIRDTSMDNPFLRWGERNLSRTRCGFNWLE